MPRWTVTYGVRWELNPAPSGGPGHLLYTFDNYDQPKQLALARWARHSTRPRGPTSRLRFGIAYQLRNAAGHETTARAGFCMFYDLGSGLLGQSAASFPYYRINSFYQSTFPLPPDAVTPPPLSLTGPVSSI